MHKNVRLCADFVHAALKDIQGQPNTIDSRDLMLAVAFMKVSWKQKVTFCNPLPHEGEGELGVGDQPLSDIG